MNKEETIEELDKLIDSVIKAAENMPRVDGFLMNAVHQLSSARHAVDITKESVYNQ